jgi:hypothetical protein
MRPIKILQLAKSPLGDLGADSLENNFQAKSRLDETVERLLNY